VARQRDWTLGQRLLSARAGQGARPGVEVGDWSSGLIAVQLIDLVLLLADHVQQSIDLMFLLVLQVLMHLTQARGTVVMGILHLSGAGDLGIIEMQVGQ